MHPISRMVISGAMRHFKDFVYNLLYFTEHNPTDHEPAQLRNFVLSIPENARAKYSKEYEFIESLGPTELNKLLVPYAVNQVNRGDLSVPIGSMHGLLYVAHSCVGGGKKLFFPNYMSLDGVRQAYEDLMRIECILDKAKSPHSYQDACHEVEQGDIILDIGCAEALFALDNIEKASKVFLYESLKDWRKPLKYTFDPYKEKTMLINKLVSDKTTRKTTTILDSLQDIGAKNSQFFV